MCAAPSKLSFQLAIAFVRLCGTGFFLSNIIWDTHTSFVSLVVMLNPIGTQREPFIVFFQVVDVFLSKGTGGTHSVIGGRNMMPLKAFTKGEGRFTLGDAEGFHHPVCGQATRFPTFNDKALACIDCTNIVEVIMGFAEAMSTLL